VRFKLIGCEVLYRELCAAIACTPHQVDVSFLPKGLHDLGASTMLERLQSEVDAIDSALYDAALLGYGLCGNGVVGLTARAIPVVLPRANDCITPFLGAKERYLESFTNHPVVYFTTSGWIERGGGPDTLSQAVLQRSGFALSHSELVARYGDENAEFLERELTRYRTRYSQFTFIEMGLEPDDRFERCTIEEAARRGWRYEKIRGSMELIHGLVRGDWEEEKYLVVPPGYRVTANYGEGIVGVEPA